MMMAFIKRTAHALYARVAKALEYFFFAWRRFWVRYDRRFLEKRTRHFDQLANLAKNRATFSVDFNSNAMSFYQQVFPDSANEIIQSADKVVQHIFDVLGSGPISIGASRGLPWHTDIKSQYQWNPKTFFRFIKFKERPGVDIKAPWELSRFQAQLALAQAFYLTRDEKYALEFQRQVLDWIEHNPPGFGVNWKSNMDVAIRAVNWLVSKDLLETHYRFPDAFLVTFYCSLFDHARFIRNHFHNVNGITSNHYLSEIAGLFFIAVLCPFYKDSPEWRDFAMRELEKEAAVQVYPDGTDYEASTSYHRLVVEILLYSLILGDKNKETFSDNFRTTVKKMCHVICDYLKPNGHAPQIGDNDSGQFIKLSSRASLDHSYIPPIAAVFFESAELKTTDECPPELFWLFGSSGYDTWRAMESKRDSSSVRAFEDSGWYMIKNTTDSLFISCGRNGKQGLGGHGHNDKLSFSLCLHGVDLVVDPGTYVYMPDLEKRNLFRSTRYHNTLYFEDIEQNDITKGLFYLPDHIRYGERSLQKAGRTTIFSGEIAYQNIRHRRIISVQQDFSEIKIHDSFSASGTGVAYVLYHLAPQISVENNRILTHRGQKLAHLDIQGAQLRTTAYKYSPGYGLAQDAIVLEACVPASGKVVITSLTKSV